MKKTGVIIILTFILASCLEVSQKPEKAIKTPAVETKKDTINVEEELQAEGTEVEEDYRYDYISTETTTSNCYIVSHFIDMDILYITVDFVSYKLKENSKNTDDESFELVNQIKTLRTFLVNENYMNCARDKNIPIEKLIEMYQNDNNLIFNIETIDGVTTELYIDTCSG